MNVNDKFKNQADLYNISTSTWEDPMNFKIWRVENTVAWLSFIVSLALGAVVYVSCLALVANSLDIGQLAKKGLFYPNWLLFVLIFLLAAWTILYARTMKYFEKKYPELFAVHADTIAYYGSAQGEAFKWECASEEVCFGLLKLKPKIFPLSGRVLTGFRPQENLRLSVLIEYGLKDDINTLLKAFGNPDGAKKIIASNGRIALTRTSVMIGREKIIKRTAGRVGGSLGEDFEKIFAELFADSVKNLPFVFYLATITFSEESKK
jgi:hypothetical protein